MGALRPRSRAVAFGSTIALVAACVWLVACAGRAETVVRYDSARVEVHLSVEDSGSTRTVVAAFIPTQEHLHLYGQEMPDGGIDGAGRPTRLAITSAAWHAVGPAVASVASTPVQLAGFDTPFPVYPDGPVTLRQPIELAVGASPDGPVDVTVTFMACSSTGVCFAPVERAPMAAPAD